MRMEHLLRVNMADLSANVEHVPEAWALLFGRKYGGRALTDAIV